MPEGCRVGGDISKPLEPATRKLTIASCGFEDELPIRAMSPQPATPHRTHPPPPPVTLNHQTWFWKPSRAHVQNTRVVNLPPSCRASVRTMSRQDVCLKSLFPQGCTAAQPCYHHQPVPACRSVPQLDPTDPVKKKIKRSHAYQEGIPGSDLHVLEFQNVGAPT
jgi:hypothetical protein